MVGRRAGLPAARDSPAAVVAAAITAGAAAVALVAALLAPGIAEAIAMVVAEDHLTSSPAQSHRVCGRAGAEPVTATDRSSSFGSEEAQNASFRVQPLCFEHRRGRCNALRVRRRTVGTDRDR